MARTISMKDEVFADNATTTIPSSPIPGVSYRNAALLATAIKNGWSYSDEVDSAGYNEILYRIASLINIVEKYGIMEWSALTDYPVDGFTMGADGKLYQALLTSGPNSGGTKDPNAGGNPTYWKDYAADIASVTSDNIERGMLLSNNATDADHDIDFSAGVQASSDYSVMGKLNSTLTKKFDATWADGNNTGGMASGVTLQSDTWYYFFALIKPDGTVNAGGDSSADATNLLADSNVIAAGYTKIRYRGACLTDSSGNIIGFKQVGQKTIFNVPISDKSGSVNTGDSITLSVPPVDNITAIINFDVYGGAGNDQMFLIRNADLSATTPTTAVFTGGYDDPDANRYAGAEVDVNGSSQIRIDISVSSFSTCHIATVGWIDNNL